MEALKRVTEQRHRASLFQWCLKPLQGSKNFRVSILITSQDHPHNYNHTRTSLLGAKEPDPIMTLSPVISINKSNSNLNFWSLYFVRCIVCCSRPSWLCFRFSFGMGTRSFCTWKLKLLCTWWHVDTSSCEIHLHVNKYLRGTLYKSQVTIGSLTSCSLEYEMTIDKPRSCIVTYFQPQKLNLTCGMTCNDT